MKSTLTICLSILSIILFSCSQGKESGKQTGDNTESIFNRLSPEATGIEFSNTIQEDGNGNYMLYDGYYQGAGLAAGDINNDGLPDLYFSGNQVPDRLYLNKGDLKFEDISAKAGVGNEKGWSTGASMADVNGDGDLDIYVCKFLWEDTGLRTNLLYINNGDGTFTEKASEFGVADTGYSIQGTFFDYDKDGWLDLYVVNQAPNYIKKRDRFKEVRDYNLTGRLYRNEQGKGFTDVTIASGVRNFGYGLSAMAADFNNDDWTDLYLAFDYDEPDLLLINNGDGTFTNRIQEQIRHISNFSMGSDVADINNDGYMDIFTADMVAPDNKRLKTQMSGMNPEKFFALQDIGYHSQYMFNSLQLNNGNGYFSEISELAGVANTDWSWATLFQDFNNDGWRDLYITNGIKHDVRDNDYKIKREKIIEEKKKQAEANNVQASIDPMELINMMPSTKLPNFAFRNNGDLTFTKVSDEWGLGEAKWSHGAVYADLDNDGDIDLVVNNMDEPAGVYENTGSAAGNYLNITLVNDQPGNKQSLNSKIRVKTASGQQWYEHTLTRGYMSQVAPKIHFGLGQDEKVDELEVTWPDGTVSTLESIDANEDIVIDKKEQPAQAAKPRTGLSMWFTDQSASSGNLPVQKENEWDDYEDEILIPHKVSTLGPAMAVADINGDGLSDVYLGGAKGYPGNVLLQNADGTFQPKAAPAIHAHAGSEDISATFFDADGDGDNDLYVVSGGNEFEQGDAMYQDRLYMNDGSGNFTYSATALPKWYVSGGCAAANDVDGDGDLDLFVGGRQLPNKWPFPVSSTLLENDGKGQFTAWSADKAGVLTDLGMVTDAEWVNLDADPEKELLICGEWMNVRYFDVSGGKLVAGQNISPTGWWNAIQSVDIDGDGDMDILAGNLGLNMKYHAGLSTPFQVYGGDLDGNGTNDIYLGYFQDGKLYPVRGRTCSSQQMPGIKKKFPTYNEFAEATVPEVLGDAIDSALHLKAEEFASMIIINEGNGNFTANRLPLWAQIGTIQDFVVTDLNADNKPDVILAGNYYNREVETRRTDASIGLILMNAGKGELKPVHPTEAGLTAYKDARRLGWIKTQKGALLMVANNNDKPQVFALQKKAL